MFSSMLLGVLAVTEAAPSTVTAAAEATAATAAKAATATAATAAIPLFAVFFGVLAIGCWCGGKPKCFPLAKSVTTLFMALVLGVLATRYLKFGTVLDGQASQISSIKSFLFLLFICATGYKIGPDFARIRWSSLRCIVVAVMLTVFSFGTIFILNKLHWLHLYELIGVTAGGVTQTAILSIAKDFLKNEIPADLKAKQSIAFSLTYVLSTVLTIFLSRHVLPFLFRRNLLQDAKDVSKMGVETHPSSKNLLLPERQSRVFPFIGEHAMPVKDVADKLLPITLQGIMSSQEGEHDMIEPGDQLILLADRIQMRELPSFLGSETMEIPLEVAKKYQYVSQSISLRAEDECTVEEYFKRCRDVVPNLYIEQITRNKCAVQWRNMDEKLRRGDKVKLFCRKEELQKLNNNVGVVIPKKADTDLILLGVAIAIGVLVGSQKIRGFSLGDGICVLIAGALIGLLHEKRPYLAGFPPQAVQLFSDFGLLGYLTLSGLEASKNISGLVDSGWLSFFQMGGKYLGCGFIITVIPFLLTALVGFKLFKKNIAMLAFSLAGSRSNTPTEQALESACGKETSGYLVAMAFMPSYAVANITLNLLGLLIAECLA